MEIVFSKAGGQHHLILSDAQDEIKELSIFFLLLGGIFIHRVVPIGNSMTLQEMSITHAKCVGATEGIGMYQYARPFHC